MKKARSVYDVRRENLQTVIGRKFGQATAAAEAFDFKTPSLIYRYLSATKPKSIGSRLARKIERIAGEPEFWMDVDHQPTAGPINSGAGGALKLEQPPASYRALNLPTLAAAVAAIESRAPLLSAVGKAQLITACYEHMMTKGVADVPKAFLDLLIGAVAGKKTHTLPKPIGHLRVAANRRRKHR
jgi:hypothetical protein